MADKETDVKTDIKTLSERRKRCKERHKNIDSQVFIIEYWHENIYRQRNRGKVKTKSDRKKYVNKMNSSIRYLSERGFIVL